MPLNASAPEQETASAAELEADMQAGSGSRGKKVRQRVRLLHDEANLIYYI